LLPGDTFSYNEVVGPRTIREGFRKAPVIVKGELVPGDGGGVCQVSTTVYMAALQAGLQIVQRSHHAFPIHYAPPGLDATVVYGAIDLRFRNNTPCPIALVAEAKNGRVVVRVLGAERYRRAVKLQRIVHAVIPAPEKTFPTASLPRRRAQSQRQGAARLASERLPHHRGDGQAARLREGYHRLLSPAAAHCTGGTGNVHQITRTGNHAC
jgi:vancomycin resistance protein YoaR